MGTPFLNVGVSTVIWEKMGNARLHLWLLAKAPGHYSNMIAARPATPAMF